MTSAIVLAGGLGTRLRDAVPGVPKPMAPVNERPFLEHLLDYWIGQGVERFLLAAGYRHEAITSYFGATYRGVPVDYTIERTPLGTGGGLLVALEKLASGKPFLLLNGDTYFKVALSALSSFHEARKADWTFSLFRAGEPGRYMGMDVALDGRITSLESGAGKTGGLANGGVYLVNPESLRLTGWKPGDKVSLEDDILPALFRSGLRFYGLECEGTFIDIGVAGDYFRASRLLAT